MEMKVIMKIFEDIMVHPQTIPHLITVFYSNRSNPIPMRNYCACVLVKNIQSYIIALINEFGFDDVHAIWKDCRPELLQNRNFEHNENRVDEVFENFEEIKKLYAEPTDVEFELNDGRVLVLDKLNSNYSFIPKETYSYIFGKYEFENDNLIFYRAGEAVKFELKNDK